MFTKNKQNKIWQKKKSEIKEESYLNYKTTIKYALCFIFLNFSSDKFAKHTKKVFVLFSSSNFLLVCLSVTIIAQKGQGVFLNI